MDRTEEAVRKIVYSGAGKRRLPPMEPLHHTFEIVDVVQPCKASGRTRGFDSSVIIGTRYIVNRDADPIYL